MKLLFCIICSLAACGTALAAESDASKLWASDLPAFLNDRPGNWIVARSEKPALSAQEAESLARRDAAHAIAPLLRAQTTGPIDETRIEAALQRDHWIADRLIEKSARPYGTIWSAAILVDASPAKIDSLVHQLEAQARRQHARQVAGAFAIMIITALVGSVYCLTNWLTRGFFRGRLAIVSFLIIASATAGVVHLL